MTQGLHSVEDIFTIFGPLYSDTREIGFSCLLVFFTLALIREFLKGVSGEANFENLFVRVFILMGLYTIYTPFFREITHGMDLLSNFFMPSEDFKDSIQKVFTAYKQNKDFGMMAFLKMTLMEWSLQGTYIVAYWVLRMFSWVRLVFLAALYVMGPIFIAIGVFQTNMARAWIKWIFEISGWNVVLSLFVRIITEMNFFEIYTAAKTPTLDLIAMNLLIIVIIVLFVPVFSSIMVNGVGGLSAAGGAALGVGTAIAGRSAIQGTKKAKDWGGNLVKGLRDFGKKLITGRSGPSGGANSYKGGR